jgi:hypothetical protein
MTVFGCIRFRNLFFYTVCSSYYNEMHFREKISLYHFLLPALNHQFYEKHNLTEIYNIYFKRKLTTLG